MRPRLGLLPTPVPLRPRPQPPRPPARLWLKFCAASFPKSKKSQTVTNEHFIRYTIFCSFFFLLPDNKSKQILSSGRPAGKCLVDRIAVKVGETWGWEVLLNKQALGRGGPVVGASSHTPAGGGFNPWWVPSWGVDRRQPTDVSLPSSLSKINEHIPGQGSQKNKYINK